MNTANHDDILDDDDAEDVEDDDEGGDDEDDDDDRSEHTSLSLLCLLSVLRRPLLLTITVFLFPLMMIILTDTKFRHISLYY